VLPLESVPNVSEGRDAATIAALGDAFGSSVALLDVHSDADHNRSVYTLAGEDGALAESLVAGIAVAVERIDVRRHEGAHPRVGSVDVVPIVPLRPEDEPRARTVALEVAGRVAEELRLPVYFYGSLTEDRREPAYFRRGNLDWLSPDRGPALHPSAGAVLVGVRPPLIALNVNLASQDLEAAREIAALVRERGGGFPGVRALGFALERAGLVQVSMNITDWEAAPPHEVVGRIRAEAQARGIEVAGTELVGLLPAGAAVAAAADPLGIGGLDATRILELRLLDGP